MIKTEDYKKVEITNAAQLRSWLEINHEQEDSIWLVTFMKSTPDRYVSREEVLDELICFGWIDGIRRKLDDKSTMQLVSPRRVHHWANSYKKRAKKLIAENRMHTAGINAINVSKKGRPLERNEKS